MSGNVELENAMRIIRFAAIAFSALFLSTIEVRADGTWCANYKNGLTNCGFYSFQQCESARWGNGGFCYRNPWVGNGVQRRSRR
jgi:hypothetical protein